MKVGSNTLWVWCEGTVTSREVIADEYVHMTVWAPSVGRSVQPGQFVMLRGEEWGQLLLNRPFDVYACDPEAGTFDVLFKVKGEGTARLGARRPGDTLQVLGPLGRGIPVERFPKGIGLIGRGAGISPMVMLAQACFRRGIPTYAFVSARAPSYLLGVDDLRRFAREVILSTDDGQHAVDPAAVFESWATRSEPVQAMYTCGSRRLGRAVLDVASRCGIEGFMFMESHMGCGIGTCHGCAVPMRRAAGDGPSYALACVDGPAFPVESVAIG